MKTPKMVKKHGLALKNQLVLILVFLGLATCKAQADDSPPVTSVTPLTANMADSGSAASMTPQAAVIQSGVSTPAELINPTPTSEKSELNKAGVYSVGGKLFIDRNTSIKTMTVSSATVSSQLDMSSHKIVNLANGSAVTDATAYGQLALFQVVMGSTTASTATTSSTFGDTTLRAIINLQSSSHRVFVLVCGDLQAATNSTTAEMTVRRVSNIVGADGLAVMRPSASATTRVSGCGLFIDSPAGTGSTTYTVQVRSTDNTNSVSFNGGGETATIVVAEIL